VEDDCLPEHTPCPPGKHGHNRAHDERRHQEALSDDLQPEVPRIPPRHTPLPTILAPAHFAANPSAGFANLRPAGAARNAPPPPPRTTPSPAASSLRHTATGGARGAKRAHLGYELGAAGVLKQTPSGEQC
jgi:hypothetical protein